MIDYKVLDNLLLGEAETDDLTQDCKEEIYEFTKTHNMDVFSDESLVLLAGIWKLAMGPSYEAITNTKIPNIFHKISVEKEENPSE